MKRVRVQAEKMVLRHEGQHGERLVVADARRKNLFESMQADGADCRIAGNVGVIVPVGKSALQGGKIADKGYSGDQKTAQNDPESFVP